MDKIASSRLTCQLSVRQSCTNTGNIILYLIFYREKPVYLFLLRKIFGDFVFSPNIIRFFVNPLFDGDFFLSYNECRLYYKKRVES